MLKLAVPILLGIFSLKLGANPVIDLKQGLTLAQINNKGRLNTLAVIEDNGDIIQAINISEISGTSGGIVSTYQAFGYEKLVDIVQNNQSTMSHRYSYTQLVSPAGTKGHHIALGLNYPEHADEVAAKRQPFLFLKTVRATREQDIATDSDTLLDYEAEVCARPLRKIDEHDSESDIEFGFFICGDFTDRAALMRNINLDDMQSGAGFNRAKSRRGYFPTGPYMVIPRDRESFLRNTSFSLYRNDTPTQRSSTASMIWPLNTIIEKTFSAQRSNRPTYSNQSKTWLIDSKITTDMTILTGTPEGVIMRPPSLGFRITRGITYLVKGAVFNRTLREHVIESYIKELQAKRVFLQNNEKITVTGSFMGRMTLKIVSDKKTPIH